MFKKKNLLIWLNEAQEDEENLVGEKASRLGNLIRLDLPIPKGFVVTSNAYQYFLNENQLQDKINHALKSCNFKSPEEVREISLLIQNFILSSPFPVNLGNKIIKAYETLSASFRSIPVAVRSRVATHLNIIGEANLIEALKNCWLTFYTPQEIFKLRDKKLNHSKINTGVVIQKMIQSEVSGIILTSNPLNKSNFFIKAIYGLGALASQGKVATDEYWVDKNRLEINKKELNKQPFELKRVKDINIEINIPLSKQSNQKLSDKKIIELSRLASRIHQCYFFPQEIEWAMEKNHLFILQSKTID